MNEIECSFNFPSRLGASANDEEDLLLKMIISGLLRAPNVATV